MPRRQITDAEIEGAALFALKASIYKCMPGVVQAYYPPGPEVAQVDVQPAVHDVRFDVDLGARVSEPWPVIPHVPLLFPKFGGYAIWGPLRAGDRVLLVSPDLDPTEHRFSGNPEDPVFTARHSGFAWVAIPGDITDPGALPNPGTSLLVGRPGGTLIEVADGRVSLGQASAVDAVALASKVNAINNLLQLFASAMSAVQPVGALAPLSAAVTAAGDLASGISTVASRTVKTAG